MKVATQKGYIGNEWLQGAVAGTNSLLVSELSKIYLRGPKFVSCEWSSLDLRGRHSQRTCASAFEPCVRIFPVPIRCKYPPRTWRAVRDFPAKHFLKERIFRKFRVNHVICIPISLLNKILLSISRSSRNNISQEGNCHVFPVFLLQNGHKRRGL